RNAHVLRLGAGEVPEHHPKPEYSDRQALHEEAAPAEPALPAGDEERPDDAVALLELGDAVCLRLDRAHVLVAEHESLLDLEPAVIRMQIGSADRRAVHA